MFERRAKIFVMVLIAIASVLLLRAAQVQLIQRQYWREQGVRAMTRPELIETSRGSLLDRKGRPIAVDGRLEWREWEAQDGAKRLD